MHMFTVSVGDASVVIAVW